MNNISEHQNPKTVLAVTSAGAVLVMIVFSLPVTTLVGTAASLSATPGEKAWILSAMSTGAAAGLLFAGSLGDNFGRAAIFLKGLYFLALSSVLAALAPTAAILVIARLLQGLGAAAVVACSLGIVGQVFPTGPERTRATGVWAAAFGAGVTLGPILAAGLETIWDWRASYWLCTALSVLLSLASKKSLALTPPSSRGPLDFPGALTLTVGVGCLLGGLTEARRGWTRPEVCLYLVIAAVLLLSFLRIEKKSLNPIIDLSLFREPGFASATLAAFSAGAGVLGLLTLTPTLLQTVYGTTALLSSVMLQAWSATTVLTAYGVRWMPHSWSAQRLLVWSLVGCGIGQLCLAGLTEESSIYRVLPGLFLAGAANGVLNAALGRRAVETVPSNQTAMGSGANNTARYIGSSLGLTLVSVLLAQGLATSGLEGMLWGWDIAVLATTTFSLAGAYLVHRISKGSPKADRSDTDSCAHPKKDDVDRRS